jgi:hypothetical protein
MPTSTDTAVERYSDGIDPYVQAYQDATEAETSVEAQQIFEEIREDNLRKNEIVERFRDGYGEAR